MTNFNISSNTRYIYIFIIILFVLKRYKKKKKSGSKYSVRGYYWLAGGNEHEMLVPSLIVRLVWCVLTCAAVPWNDLKHSDDSSACFYFWLKPRFRESSGWRKNPPRQTVWVQRKWWVEGLSFFLTIIIFLYSVFLKEVCCYVICLWEGDGLRYIPFATVLHVASS